MKVDDEVKIIGQKFSDSNYRNTIGRICIIKNLYSESYTTNGFAGKLWELVTKDTGQQTYSYDCDIKINNKNNMNIKENFTLAFKKEPEKSFRKTGITNGDDFLTEDGQLIFLSWLLKKHGDEFKTDVVDGLLKEQEDENK